MSIPSVSVRLFTLVVFWLAGTALFGAEKTFDVPAQPVADALILFSQQASTEVLFSTADLRDRQSHPVAGRYEPGTALELLLRDTALTARRNFRGKFVVTPAPSPPGTLTGRVTDRQGRPVSRASVKAANTRRATRTDVDGEFVLTEVPPGIHRLIVAAPDFQSVMLSAVHVESGARTRAEIPPLPREQELLQLDPYLVEGKSARNPLPDRGEQVPRIAAGNLDLPRTENDALPYKIYTREQLARSGVVNLNDFLQSAVLDGDNSSRPPDQNGNLDSFLAGSTNLNLRGFGADSTVVLVNGRRLPEVINTFSGPQPPDVNLIPLGLVQQVEILPVSASALYTGNPVGGVINIVLRQDLDATEVTTTYNNALDDYDAPQFTVSLQHGQSLLDGRLRLRLSTTFTEVNPPLESELGYRRSRPQAPVNLNDPIFRATPNVRSRDEAPLFGLGSASVTSVAPGATGNGGLAAFAGRAGLRNFDSFDTGGGMAASLNSQQYPYGRSQERAAYFGSVTYDATPWLQIGLDAFHARTRVNRGYDLVTADLELATTSPLNPFGQAVRVSLNEFAPWLGERYSEARMESSSAVLGLLVKLPRDWRVNFDTQYSRNLSRYRGIAGANLERWQALVDAGVYNPLRDTQVVPAPALFYDRVLVYRGPPGAFTELGDYTTLDGALRVTNQSLQLPTGVSAINVGADYRRNELAPYTDTRQFADGTLAEEPTVWIGRRLERYSVFGELQTPLLPTKWLPAWIRLIEADVALRYIAAETSQENNFAPALGLKADFVGGLSARGSVTLSSRFPTPSLSRQSVSNSPGNGGVDLKTIFDPRRNETYDVQADEPTDPGLSAEDAVTQTAGLIFQRGQTHRFRAAVDFVDTTKTNELVGLDPQAVVNLESQLPERLTRAAAAPGDPSGIGRIVRLLTGSVNAAERRSQHWNTSLEYAWNECVGGTLEMRAGWLHFQRYNLTLLSRSAPVDELAAPDGAVPSLLRDRLNIGAAWSNPRFGFGADAHYYHARILPLGEQPSQGSNRVKAYAQIDAFVHRDLTQLLPWKSHNVKLRGQLRVNNVFGFDYPKYVNDASGAGIQAYGDFRGRTYSVSLSASF